MKYQLLFLLILFSYTSFSQITSSTKWGRVSQEEIDYKVVPFDKEAGAVVLFEEGTLNVESRLETKVYRRIKVLNEKGIEAANQEIEYYALNGSQSITGFSAQTLNTINGETKVISVDKNAIFDQDLNEFWNLKKFTFPDVQVGSIIEYRYTLLDKNLYFSEAWRFQHEYPTLFSTYSITNRRLLDYNFIAIGQKMLEHYSNKKSDKSNRWTLTNVPSYNSIEFIYNKKDMSERILLQLTGYATRAGHFNDRMGHQEVIRDWKALNNEVLSMFNSYKNNFSAKEIASAIPNGKNDLETIKNVYDYFRSNFKWTNYIGIQPRQSTKDIVKSKSGNSAELNLLLNQILENKGINSELIILSGRNNGKLIVSYPYIGQFNNLVNLVKLKDNSSFMIDASNLTYEMGYMPLHNYNHFALILDKSKEDIISIQPPLSEYSSKQLYVLKDNKILLSRTDKRNGYFKDISTEKLPSGIHEHSIIKNSLDILMDESNTMKRESEDKSFEMIRSNYDVNFYQNSSFIGIENALKELVSNYTLTENNRKRPLEFEFPFLYQVSIEIPEFEGYKIEIPTGYNSHFEAVDKSLAYYQKAEIKDDKLYLQIEFYSAKSIYADNYAEIKSFFEKANLSATKVILLKKA